MCLMHLLKVIHISQKPDMVLSKRKRGRFLAAVLSDSSFTAWTMWGLTLKYSARVLVLLKINNKLALLPVAEPTPEARGRTF